MPFTRALLATVTTVLVPFLTTTVTVPVGWTKPSYGAGVLLLEGGPSVNAEFFALGAVDELFLTVGPVVVGGRETLTPVEGETSFGLDGLKRLRVASAVVNEETDELYLRYRVVH